MELTVEKKEGTFKVELDQIYDRSIKEFTRLCVLFAPDYFFLDCPASSSGKYHPIDELGSDGTILHTRKVFVVANELCRGLGCEDFKDEILSACIIHDLRKQGMHKTGHTVKNHPDLAAQLVDTVYNDTQTIDRESYSIIRNAVGYHYGLWSINPWKKPLAAYTTTELCLYLSDYTASKRCMDVKM